MKTIQTLTAATVLSLALAACATSPASNTGPTPADFDASADHFEGWARVADGEIRLYAQQRDLNRWFSTDCVSGALPRAAQDAAADLNGSKIRLHGATLRWIARDGRETHNWQGSRIVNNCRRDVVILADRVEVLQ